MKIFFNLYSVLFFSVTFAHGFGNTTFPASYLVKILQAESTEISEICKEHLKLYVENLINIDSTQKGIWANQMFDSITKFPDGILMGRIHFPGHFDECVEASNENFRGKHCMLKVNFTEENEEIESILKLRALPDELKKRIFHFGVCVPSTCSANDIKNAVKAEEKLNFINVNLNETDCSIKGYRSFRSEDFITLSVIIGIIVLVVLSTAYDIYHKSIIKAENPSQLWTSFSIYTTGKQLFRISQSSSQLKCLHGIRFLSMCWVILAHSYFSFMFAYAINLVEILKLLGDKSFTPVSNGFVSVDSFFFLSGLLVCLVFFRDIAKKGSYDAPVAFIHRYIRLTPPFAILMLIQATIISRIGNGPFWNAAADHTENSCRESWWTGILYVQNYLFPASMCLGQAWYLSADMQMYWLSPLILYPMLWFPSLAPFFVGLLVLAAAFTNFTVAYLNNLNPNLLMKGNSDMLAQFKLEYAPFHTRMAPWLIGLATGYIICGIQAKKINIRMTKVWALCGWLVAIAILGGTLFGIVRFIPDTIFESSSNDFSLAESAFYLAFHRVGWALGLAWIVIACVSGHGGIINDFLSLDIFQPLAKLSYCNFLIHMTLQNYRINSSRTNQYLRHFEVVYAFFGDLIISHLISIPVVLFFEFPFTNIGRYFLHKLEIFPFPRKEHLKKEIQTEKPKESEETPEDIEKGKINVAFNET